MTLFKVVYNKIFTPKEELGQAASDAAKLGEQVKAIDKKMTPIYQEIQSLIDKMKTQGSPAIQQRYDSLTQEYQKLFDQRALLADQLKAAVIEVSGLRKEVFGEPGNGNERPSSTSSTSSSKRQGTQ